MTDTLLDPAALEELRSLEVDNPGFLCEIVRQFLDDDAPARLHAIREAIDEGDQLQAGREAHGLKNSCSVVGASLMREICQQLERVVRAEPERTMELFEQLERAFDTISTELRKLTVET